MIVKLESIQNANKFSVSLSFPNIRKKNGSLAEHHEAT